MRAVLLGALWLGLSIPLAVLVAACIRAASAGDLSSQVERYLQTIGTGRRRLARRRSLRIGAVSAVLALALAGSLGTVADVPGRIIGVGFEHRDLFGPPPMPDMATAADDETAAGEGEAPVAPTARPGDDRPPRPHPTPALEAVPEPPAPPTTSASPSTVGAAAVEPGVVDDEAQPGPGPEAEPDPPLGAEDADGEPSSDDAEDDPAGEEPPRPRKGSSPAGSPTTTSATSSSATTTTVPREEEEPPAEDEGPEPEPESDADAEPEPEAEPEPGPGEESEPEQPDEDSEQEPTLEPGPA